MARIKYSCDLETTTHKQWMDKTAVWAAAYMEIGGKWEYNYFNNLDDFMIKWALKGEKDLYYHNLSFDGRFITDWLFKNDYTYDTNLESEKTFRVLVSDMGVWYGIDICNKITEVKTGKQAGKRKRTTTKIFDSLKKLPGSVKSIAKSFKLNVEKLDVSEDFYDKNRIPGEHVLTEEEENYLKADVEVIAKALYEQFEAGLTGMTTSQDAYRELQECVGKRKFEALFPQMKTSARELIKRGYKGGFTWVNELDNLNDRIIGAGVCFDVNSLYPSRMYYCKIPYGAGVYFEGEYKENEEYDLYTITVTFSFKLKQGKIPCIQIKDDPRFTKIRNKYLIDDGGDVVTQTYTSIDWELINDQYDVDVQVFHGGFMFKSVVGAFNKFIDKHYTIKRNSKGAKKQISKLLLNGSYGKFGQSPDKTGKIPRLDEDGVVKWDIGEEKIDDTANYLPAAMFITAHARDYTIRTAQRIGRERIIYCDTDSIFMLGIDVPEWFEKMVDPDELGFWKKEYYFEIGKFIRAKSYMVEVYGKMIWDEKEGKEIFVECHPDESTTTKTKIKCAGMPDSVKNKKDPATGLPQITFDNFKVGEDFDGAKKAKTVKGGCLLIPQTFKIKDFIF